MARSRKRESFLAGAGLVLSLLLLAQSAPAQEGTPTPYSKECQAGSETISDSPLPNVTIALQKHKRIRILTIGASASAGPGATHGGYTALIRQILERAIQGLDVTIINRGVSGELAADAARRIMTQIALEEPDLVLWQVGTNDALAYIPVEAIEATVVDTIRRLRQYKVDLILVGLQGVGEMLRDQHYIAVRDMLRKVAARENVIIIRRSEAMKIIDQAKGDGMGYIPDEFERNEAGYTCLAQYIARAITLGVFGNKIKPPKKS
jgi:lysophospholipase L1-like esterase